MKRCSQCGEAESMVELTQIEGGEVRKVPLCAKCAAEKGIQTPAAYADTPLGSLLAALGGDPLVPETPAIRAGDACPGCGATLDDFRQTGRLGCEQCYTSFAEPLGELLRRLHASVHHAGKAPGGAIQVAPPGESLPVLKERLRQAVAAEQFELAAKLRDQLKGLQ
ncbi:MAG: UvrB/UvrC motif-containing protein [Gemmatimonadales bacterium]